LVPQASGITWPVIPRPDSQHKFECRAQSSPLERASFARQLCGGPVQVHRETGSQRQVGHIGHRGSGPFRVSLCVGTSQSQPELATVESAPNWAEHRSTARRAVAKMLRLLMEQKQKPSERASPWAGITLTRSRGGCHILRRHGQLQYVPWLRVFDGVQTVQCSTRIPNGHVHRGRERRRRVQHRATPGTEGTTKRAHCFQERVLQAMAELATNSIRLSSSAARRTPSLDGCTLYLYTVQCYYAVHSRDM
jgi:hypothetical protein